MLYVCPLLYIYIYEISDESPWLALTRTIVARIRGRALWSALLLNASCQYGIDRMGCRESRAVERVVRADKSHYQSEHAG